MATVSILSLRGAKGCPRLTHDSNSESLTAWDKVRLPVARLVASVGLCQLSVVPNQERGVVLGDEEVALVGAELS